MSPVTAFPFRLMKSGSTEMLFTSSTSSRLPIGESATDYARADPRTTSASIIEVVIIGANTDQPAQSNGEVRGGARSIATRIRENIVLGE